MIYGLTTNIQNKANPFHINFHEFVDMIRDVKHANGWREKLFFVFGSPSKIALYKKEQQKEIREANGNCIELPYGQDDNNKSVPSKTNKSASGH